VSVQSLRPLTPAEQNHWTPFYYHPKPTNIDFANIDSAQFAATTIPFYTKSYVSPLDGHTYKIRTVGANPSLSTTTTNVTYVPIVVKFKFGTVTLDPTKPGCGDTVSVQSRFFNGPNFTTVPQTSNGVNVGTVQIIDGFQRAEFWKTVKAKGGTWHTNLVASGTPIILTKTAPAGSQLFAGVCSGSAHDIGTIDINAFDTMIQGIVKQFATPTQVPLVLSYNVFETSGGQCCIIGYHNAYVRSSGTQTYAISAYNDPGIFSVPIEDIHAWNHEIGELFNDPFVESNSTVNFVPAWGHVGQVSGCQNNLEVGDPLTGTPYTVSLNGFTYHPQELAFQSWFLRQSPSGGTGGKYSYKGSFTTVQGACT
jgi:hypothetical protein